MLQPNVLKPKGLKKRIGKVEYKCNYGNGTGKPKLTIERFGLYVILRLTNGKTYI